MKPTILTNYLDVVIFVQKEVFDFKIPTIQHKENTYDITAAWLSQLTVIQHWQRKLLHRNINKTGQLYCQLNISVSDFCFAGFATLRMKHCCLVIRAAESGISLLVSSMSWN